MKNISNIQLAFFLCLLIFMFFFQTSRSVATTNFLTSQASTSFIKSANELKNLLIDDDSDLIESINTGITNKNSKDSYVDSIIPIAIIKEGLNRDKGEVEVKEKIDTSKDLLKEYYSNNNSNNGNLSIEKNKKRLKYTNSENHSIHYNENNDNWISNHSCSEIKKYNKEKEYCVSLNIKEIKSSKSKINSTVNCMKDFCPVCCKTKSVNNDNFNNNIIDTQQCNDLCSKERKFYTSNNTLDILNSVCEYDNMKKIFNNYCGFFKENDNDEEYESCFKNFCFDCCTKELGIDNSNWNPNNKNDPFTKLISNEINDIENGSISKCLKKCFPKENKEIKEMRQETNIDNSKNNNISEDSNNESQRNDLANKAIIKHDNRIITTQKSK